MDADTVNPIQEKIDSLNQQAAHLRFESPQDALPLALEALKLSQNGSSPKMVYKVGVAESLTNLAFAHNRLGNREQALTYALDALSHYEREEGLKPTATIYFTLGSIYMALSDYAEALTHYYQALDLAQEQEERQLEASILNHIGIIHNRMGDHEQTNEACTQALALYRELGDRSGEATIYNNQAMACFARQSYDEALSYARQALALAEEIGHTRLTTSVHATIGEIYVDMAAFSQAESHLQKSLALARSNQIAYIMMYSYLLLGRMRNQQNNPEEALVLLQAALAMAEEISVRQDTAVCHRALTQTYRMLGDFAQALHHFEAYHRIQQEIFNEESDHRLRNLQVIHQTKSAQQAAEIYQLRNVALQQEITERQRAETALQEANAQLQRQNEELDAYAHTVAHDLKQPLTAVGMYADMLVLYGAHLDTSKQAHALGQMKRASERAIRIVDELLLLATIPEKEIELQPLDMALILENVQQRLNPMLTEFNATLTLPAPCPVALGYAPWIEEVWANYISNAIKYGGRSPVIECGVSSLTDGSIQFWVRDCGPGISAEVMTRLFTPFNRNANNTAEGHGLGLSIVKRIITRLGGEVGVESQLGQGSRFTFTLPAAP